jgi:hypothetical protein
MGHWIDGLPSKLFHNEGNGQFTVIQIPGCLRTNPAEVGLRCGTPAFRPRRT